MSVLELNMSEPSENSHLLGRNNNYGTTSLPQYYM